MKRIIPADDTPRESIMSVVQCEICRNYYDSADTAEHRCHGLRTADWVRFLHELRHWMSTDKHAQFEAYYLRRRKAANQPPE
jgi:hypothetical protein